MAKKKQKSSNENNEKEYLIEKSPYKYSPSFIEHNGKIATILQLYIRPGSNRQMTYDQVIDFIPTTTLQGIEIYLLIDDKLIKNDDKKRLIRKNSTKNKATIEDTEKHDGNKQEDDESAKKVRAADMQDYSDYELILDSAEPVVAFRWRLMIVGPDYEVIDEQIELLNQSLDSKHDGARWDSLPGEQEKEFTNLFDAIEPSRFVHSSTGSNYAKLSVAVNAGLMDPQGLPIGVDALSLSGTTAYFDFAGSLVSQAAIAMSSSSQVTRYFIDEAKQSKTPAASIIAQYTANHFVFKGSRVHHIVLNQFDYFQDNVFYRPAITKQLFTRYNVAKETINPLQGFGDLADVTNVYSRLIRKIVNLFDLMQNLSLQTDERAIILNAIDQFYFNQGYWTNDADIHPARTQIVNIAHPENYQTLPALINEFSTLATQAARNNRELKADRIDTIQSLLTQSIATNQAVLGRTTKIKPTTSAQVYYDFSEIESLQMKQMQLVNMIEYIIYTAKPGDLIIIHGFDQILSRVSNMILDAIRSAKAKGIKFLYTFDSISSSTREEGKMNDIFEMKSKYYNDLDTDMSWSIIGNVLPAELDLFQTALNSELGTTVSQMMTNKVPNQALVHRRQGGVNNFIYLDVLI